MKYDTTNGTVEGTPAELAAFVRELHDAIKRMETPPARIAPATPERKAKKWSRWTDSEDEYILYSGRSIKGMARMLGRTKDAVYKRRSVLRGGKHEV